MNACGVTGEDPVDIDVVKKIAPQLLGEAAAIERELAAVGRHAFEPPASVLKTAKKLQADRYETDPIHEMIEAALSDRIGQGGAFILRDYSFIATVDLKTICGLEANDRDTRAHKMIAKAMTALGWRHVPHGARPRIDGKKVGGFEKGARPFEGIKDEHIIETHVPKDRDGTPQCDQLTIRYRAPMAGQRAA